MINLRSCFEENSLETYEDLQRTCLTIILHINPLFVDVFMTVVVLVYITPRYLQVTRLIDSALVHKAKDKFLGYIELFWSFYFQLNPCYRMTYSVAEGLKKEMWDIAAYLLFLA